MWKLKVGEGESDPYLFSLNNFTGRQTWEFDPEAGTAEERAEVEAARRNFYDNRFKVHPSSDLLWRYQVINRYFKFFPFYQSLNPSKFRFSSWVFTRTVSLMRVAICFIRISRAPWWWCDLWVHFYSSENLGSCVRMDFQASDRIYDKKWIDKKKSNYESVFGLRQSKKKKKEIYKKS